MMALSPRKKLIAVASVSFISVAVLAGAFLWMARSVRHGVLARQAIAQDIADLAEDRAAARNAAALVRSRAADLDRVKNFFVDRERPVAFVEDLERLAKDTDTVLALGVDEGGSDKDTFLFHLSVEGDRARVIRYVRGLEAIPYVIHVDEMSLEKGNPESYRAGIASGRGPKMRLMLTIRVKIAAS